ncbi:MAG: NAD(P)-binding domain-containing protein, partial [Bdellovibrionales bacterium]|nr:NAD(P)-binding domain-containing protein [Bdellovibrionales bacterium]
MKIGFFGCGNMGSALAIGFKKTYPDLEQYFFTPSLHKAEELALRVQGHVVRNLEDMPRDLDWYILAFKPQSLPEFSFDFESSSKVLSVLAGTGIASLEKKFQIKNIARLMPNTPSSIGEGANLLFSPFPVGNMEDMLRSLGKLFTMTTEAELDAITAFSGSGPALIFEFARIFEKHLNLKVSGNSD